MLAAFAAAVVVTVGSQSTPADRTRAELLARSGRSAEAIQLFEQIVAEHPSDVEARLWIARLELRVGRTDEAEAGFRSVIREHPTDIDARIGLGAALTRKGDWADALAVLEAVEPEAGENSDLFGALARAYRRAGDDRAALEYFERGKTLAPSDADLVSGFEDTARAYGHSIFFEGFGERASTGTNAGSGTLAVRVRATNRLHVDGIARVEQRAGASDTAFGGGALWRSGGTNIMVRAIGGADTTILPGHDVSADVVHYTGMFELGGGIRQLSFNTDDVTAASSIVALDGGGMWRLDTRYTFSRTSFATGASSGDNSVLLRETWRRWRRASVNLSYAYGIEDFENLTAVRLRALGATTVAGGVRITMPSLTMVTATWEHQWRTNDTSLDRLSVSIVQSFP